MFTPETSKHFKEYTDESGVVSYILTTRVAPVQQCPYFTNPGMTPISLVPELAAYSPGYDSRRQIYVVWLYLSAVKSEIPCRY